LYLKNLSVWPPGRAWPFEVKELVSLPRDRHVERLDEIDATLKKIIQRYEQEEQKHWQYIADNNYWGIMSPGRDVAAFYQELADSYNKLAQLPEREWRQRRIAKLEALRQKVRQAVAAEEATVRHLQQIIPRNVQIAQETSKAMAAGPVSVDTVDYCPAIGRLAQEVYEYSHV
jgi:hypothetical protein